MAHFSFRARRIAVRKVSAGKSSVAAWSAPRATTFLGCLLGLGWAID